MWSLFWTFVEGKKREICQLKAKYSESSHTSRKYQAIAGRKQSMTLNAAE
jgi:hypothetical protein